ncbi:hypothetical protein DS832_01485 [Bombilactobacillus bombi]|uniref:Uncharacterized protein n=1 Tax=Bombilactobacillus bombi TaxID=1303590 RepID=A0A417ZC77_9LACO|nr:hypothetical protein [Bombilactobacillus bombi]RHW48264.1 hypothetical protein DS832_01485 [Bombilactobacillus bombi]
MEDAKIKYVQEVLSHAYFTKDSKCTTTILEMDARNHSIASVGHGDKASLIIDGISCNDGLIEFSIFSTAAFDPDKGTWGSTVARLKVDIELFVNGSNRLTEKQLKDFTVKEVLDK